MANVVEKPSFLCSGSFGNFKLDFDIPNVCIIPFSEIKHLLHYDHYARKGSYERLNGSFHHQISNLSGRDRPGLLIVMSKKVVGFLMGSFKGLGRLWGSLWEEFQGSVWAPSV